MATTYYSSRVTVNPAAQVVQYLLRILEILLALRFFLRLFGANPAAGFTHFVYSASYPFVAPFANVFRASTATSPPGSVFEWTTLLAMIVYWVVAAIIIRLFTIGQPAVIREAAAYEDDDDEVV